MILTDTNILLRMADPRDPHYPVVKAAYAALRQAGRSLIIAPQNLYEFWVAATRPLERNGLGLEPNQVVTQFRKLEQGFQLHLDPLSIFDDWLQLVVQHDCRGKPAHDARLVAFMNGHNITELLTFNTGDFGRFTHITVIDPAKLPLSP